MSASIWLQLHLYHMYILELVVFLPLSAADVSLLLV